MIGMPDRRTLIAIPALFTALAVGIPFMPDEAAAGAPEADVLEIVSFGSLRGDLTPCGCRIPRGGLPRRSQVVKSLEESGTPYLHLDLGDFTKEDEVSGEFVTGFLWKAFQAMNVHAVGVGPMELSAWPQFATFLQSGEIPIISSNVSFKAGGETRPIGEQYMIFSREGVRVAVFCLMGADEFAGIKPPEGVSFAFEDPRTKARDLIPALREKADLVVLMSQMSPAATDSFLLEVGDIDVALYGQWAAWRPQASKVRETIVNQTGMKGEYLGRLALVLGSDRKIRSFHSRNAALDHTYADDPVVGALTEEAEARRDELVREHREKRQEEFERRFLGK